MSSGSCPRQAKAVWIVRRHDVSTSEYIDRKSSWSKYYEKSFVILSDMRIISSVLDQHLCLSSETRLGGLGVA